MRLHHLTALVLILPLAACGFMEDGEDKLTSWSDGLQQAGACMMVHAAGASAGVAPLAISKVTPDTADLLQGMRETAESLPLDDAGQPTLRDAYRRMVDRLDKVKGQSPEVIMAMVASGPYQQDFNLLGNWYKTHCATDEQPPANDT